MIIEYSIEDLRSELVSDDRKAIEGILRTALHDVVEQIKAGSETSRNINDRGRQSFPGTSHTTIHWQSRQMSDGKLTAYGVVSELKSLFEQNELYDERLVFFTKEFPKIVRLSNQLNITIGEFTLDEMGQLATGEADQALLAKYSRSVLVEEISPYDFFSQGNSFAASEEPYTEFDSAASDDQAFRDGFRQQDISHRYSAADLSQIHADGVNNNNTIEQYWRMPDGNDWKSVVHTPQIDGRNGKVAITLVPVNHEAEVIEITPELTVLPGMEDVVFECWDRRVLVGAPKSGISFGSGSRSSTDFVAHIEGSNFMRTKDSRKPQIQVVDGFGLGVDATDIAQLGGDGPVVPNPGVRNSK